MFHILYNNLTCKRNCMKVGWDNWQRWSTYDPDLELWLVESVGKKRVQVECKECVPWKKCLPRILCASLEALVYSAPFLSIFYKGSHRTWESQGGITDRMIQCLSILSFIHFPQQLISLSHFFASEYHFSYLTPPVTRIIWSIINRKSSSLPLLNKWECTLMKAKRRITPSFFSAWALII